MRTSVRPAPDVPRRADRSGRIIRAIGIIGRVFVVAGLILLFYTAYLLWGTGLYTAQHQQHAAQELAANPLVDEQVLAEGGDIPPARPGEVPELGAPLYTMKIPKLGLEQAVFFGVGREELKRGPGQFPDCEEVGPGVECVSGARYPGEDGNVPLSGHRTTYGAPFFNLHELAAGDVIDLVSGRARYRYQVREQQIVDPVGGWQVVEQHGRAELTLTTCHPRFSAAQRLIIHADYIGAALVEAVPAGTDVGGPTRSGPQPVVAPDVLALMSISLGSAWAALALSRRWRKTAIHAGVVVVVAAGLWVGVFPRVLAMMPANY